MIRVQSTAAEGRVPPLRELVYGSAGSFCDGRRWPAQGAPVITDPGTTECQRITLKCVRNEPAPPQFTVIGQHRAWCSPAMGVHGRQRER